MVEPLSGTPSIYPRLLSAHLRLGKRAGPIDSAAAATCDTTFVGSPYACSPNMSLTYLCEESLVALTSKMYFALTWRLGIEDDIVKVSHEFLDQTTKYWRTWVKHCSIPMLYQEEVIRSALALKLHC